MTETDGFHTSAEIFTQRWNQGRMPSATGTLIRAFWGICTFRLAPQDIPGSSALLAVVTAANLVFSTLINQIRLPLGSSLFVALLEMVVVFALTFALLHAFSRAARALQTLTALMGTGAVIGGLVLLVLFALPALPQPARIAIFLWNLFVMAHILRHALDTRFIVGFFVAFGYALFLVQLVVFIDRLLGPAPA